jgi:hypothetical protein
MRTVVAILFTSLIFLVCCNSNNSETKSASESPISADTRADSYPFVTAKINGKEWHSVKDEILATYSEIDDKLQIFTKDAEGKMNFLLMMSPFSKTGVGTYNSVREGAGGYGISLLEENTKDDEVLNYDNFRQGAVAGCLSIVSIKETAEGKIVEGNFASAMNISNNYDAGKGKVEVTDGRFAVLLKK